MKGDDGVKRSYSISGGRFQAMAQPPKKTPNESTTESYLVENRIDRE